MTHPQLLWLILLLIYTVLSFRLLTRLESLPYFVGTSITSVLLMTAFSFKLDFTREDAPELVVGFARQLHEMFQGLTLLWRARIVFMLISSLMAYGTYRALTRGRFAKMQSGKSFTSCRIVRGY